MHSTQHRPLPRKHNRHTSSPNHPLDPPFNLPQTPVPDAQPLSRLGALPHLLSLRYHHPHPAHPQLQLDLLECVWPDELLGREEGKLVTTDRGEMIYAGLRVHMGVSYGIPDIHYDVQVGGVGCEGEGGY